MTVHELQQSLSLRVFHLGDGQRQVTGGYTGDLLSWVMGKCREGDCWITIMSNRNVAAVAQLTDCALVLLSEGVEPDEDCLQAFKQRGMNLLGAQRDSFSLCQQLYSLLK